jgi:hypothetical protein
MSDAARLENARGLTPACAHGGETGIDTVIMLGS